ncbi:MAG: hypothetical protein ACR2OC_11615 [Solirubrobacterales bacterium]
MRDSKHERRWVALVIVAVAGLAGGVSAIAVAQTGGGYDPAGGYTTTTTGGRGGGGGGTGSGQVNLSLKAKKTQKSLKAVKVKATCTNRACMINAKGKLRAGKKKAKLKPDQEALTDGATDTLTLKLSKKAKKIAKSALRKGQKVSVKVTAKAEGVDGGGSDSASVKIRLKK